MRYENHIMQVLGSQLLGDQTHIFQVLRMSFTHVIHPACSSLSMTEVISTPMADVFFHVASFANQPGLRAMSRADGKQPIASFAPDTPNLSAW